MCSVVAANNNRNGTQQINESNQFTGEIKPKVYARLELTEAGAQLWRVRIELEPALTA